MTVESSDRRQKHDRQTDILVSEPLRRASFIGCDVVPSCCHQQDTKDVILNEINSENSWWHWPVYVTLASSTATICCLAAPPALRSYSASPARRRFLFLATSLSHPSIEPKYYVCKKAFQLKRIQAILPSLHSSRKFPIYDLKRLFTGVYYVPPQQLKDESILNLFMLLTFFIRPRQTWKHPFEAFSNTT